MIILGVDSTSKSASAALVKDGVLISEYFLNCGLTHSKTLMNLIEKCMSDAQVDVNQIDNISVSVGPGSFTGVRIGIAAVKGIAFTNDIFCCPISTLEALAVSMKAFTGKIYSVLDARCNQVYFAEFESDSKTIKRLCNDTAVSLDDIKKRVHDENDKIIFVGDGAELCYNYVGDSKQVFIADANLRFTRASSVAMCYDEKKIVKSESLTPSYLRLSQAQRNLKNNR